MLISSRQLPIQPNTPSGSKSDEREYVARDKHRRGPTADGGRRDTAGVGEKVEIN